MTRRPRSRPLSLATGARPTRLVIWRRPSCPSSGSLASRVARRIAPAPGVPASSAALSACSSGSAADGVAHQLVELGLVAAQSLQRRLRPLDQAGCAQLAQLLGARRDLGQELAAIGQQLGQGVARAGPDRRRHGPGEGAVAGDDRGIEAIGLGQAPARLGEVAHPQALTTRALTRARSAGDAPGVRSRPTPPSPPGCRARATPPARPHPRHRSDRQSPPAGQAKDIQLCLADVDPDHAIHPLSLPCLRA